MILPVLSCNHHTRSNELSIVNLEHLKHLYTEIEMKSGARVGVLHIYSEHPDYEYTIEDDEGFTCVDDVARAMVFLTGHLKFNDDPEARAMIMDMTKFILEMQSENGYFHNFLWGDGSVNTTYRTSVAEPNWWSWRALWALAEVYPLLPEELALHARTSAGILVSEVFERYIDLPMDTILHSGLQLPGWFPLETAFDQTALLIIAMETYYHNIFQDKRVLELIERFSGGLLLTQKGNAKEFPHFAFLSWNNLWHSYGNIQSYALIKSGILLGRDDLVNAALKEIDHFYPYLLENGIAHHFYLEKSDDGLDTLDYTRFPQIAYGVRPIVYACVEAYEVTGDKKYATMARKAASWLHGNNPASTSMYDPSTGRCYDGIVSDTIINLNSGAESTIEALLTLQAINKLPIN
jgi:hypothetical protein